MKRCFFVCLALLSIAVTSDLKVFCVDRSSYKVGICVDNKCEKSVTPLEMCVKEGQLIKFDVDGQSRNVICKNPQVVCQDSIAANRTLFERQADANEKEEEVTDTEAEKPTTPKSTTIQETEKPTTPKTTTAAPTVGLPDEPIVIPDNVNGVVNENNKKVIQAKLEYQAKLTKEEIKSQAISEKQANMIINSKPFATEETTKKFMNLFAPTTSGTTSGSNTNGDKIVMTSTEAVDMTDYNKTDLNEKTFDGNNQEIILQFNMKKINSKNSGNGGGRRRRLSDDSTTYEDDENVISLQMFSELNNTVIKNLKISVIVKNSNNNNNNNNNLGPIEVRECGLFGRINNVTLQNVVVIFYNPITFTCSANSNTEDSTAAGILVNEATDSILNRVKVEFASFGNGLLYLNTTNNVGLLIGSGEGVTITNSHVIGDSLIVYGSNKVVGGMIAELEGDKNEIKSSYVDLYFLSLYNQISYGGLIGECNGKVEMIQVSNYIRRGLTIGVKTGDSSFSFGGLISLLKESESVEVSNSWVSIKTYGIEANSTTTYFGGFIGNANEKVTIERSYVRIYTGHKRFILEAKEGNTDIKIGYYFGDRTNGKPESLVLNETSAFVQGCTTIDCVYQPYYKIDIFSSATNTREPTKENRVLADSYINLVTGEGAMSIDDTNSALKDNKFGFTDNIETFASQSSMQIGEDGQIYNPVYPQPDPNAPRPTVENDVIDLSPVKEAVVVKKLCENDCNNHGVCQYGKCVCYPGYLPSTCLYRSCPYGTSFSNPSNEYEKDDRINYECSNQGICNRNTGLCECFAGYEGNACQRKSCPNQCSGHGVCETVGNVEMTENNNMIIHNDKEYIKWDRDHMQVCVCDKEYTGYDCSQKKCPYGYIQGNDCEAGEFTSIKMTISKTGNSDITITLDGDCSLKTQYVYLKYTDLWGRDWYTEKFDVGCLSGWKNAIGKLPPGVISLDPNYGIEFTKNGTKDEKPSNSESGFYVTIIFSKHQTGRQNVLEVLTKETVEGIPEIKNGGTFHTITDRDLITNVEVKYEMDLVSPPEECSNAGICDRSTGLCKCFEGYIGNSCNQANSAL